MVIYQMNREQAPSDVSDFEIVERKGLGHPDTLADGIAEAVSAAYSQYCLEHFGMVLHHNVDKISLHGGAARAIFGGGELLDPIRVALQGRMSTCFGTTPIDVGAIAEKAARSYLGCVLPRLQPHEIIIQRLLTEGSHASFWFRPRSVDDLPEQQTLRANDTSCCVGYWPLTPTERLALALEGLFHVDDGSPRFADIGSDIKVMLVRIGSHLQVTMCIPLIGAYTTSAVAYCERLGELRAKLMTYIVEQTNDAFRVTLAINTADVRQADKYYLTVVGTALEGGEEGMVGRGNRANGIIASTRPYSMEAPCGKNPVYHVGKVYAVVSRRVARAIAESVGAPCTVYMVSRNGDVLQEPSVITIECKEEVPPHLRDEILHNELGKLPAITTAIISGYERLF